MPSNRRQGERVDTAEPVVLEAAEPEPAVAQRQRRIKDSDPLPESRWAPDPGARPYGDAVTDEHRAHLKENGLEPERPSKKD